MPASDISQEQYGCFVSEFKVLCKTFYFNLLIMKSSVSSFLLSGQSVHLWGASMTVNCLLHLILPIVFLYMMWNYVINDCCNFLTKHQLSLFFDHLLFIVYCLTLILLLSIISFYTSDSFSEKLNNYNKEHSEKYTLIPISLSKTKR